MTYQEAVKKINSLLRFGSRPGLERITKLLSLMGNPQDKLSYIHVAGTNGKGSVCTLLASVLKSAGYKTGLFTSPFIIDFRERMQIDGKMIPENDLSSITAEVFPLVEQMAQNNEIITEFELVTAIAFAYFARQGCDVVVLETGLGGRFDSTNVIKTPLCSVITSISLDHTAVLGDSLEKIAFEKCGIIKPRGDTVFYPQEAQVNAVVIRSAEENQNRLFYADAIALTVLSGSIDGTRLLYNGQPLVLPFIGSHQVKNAKTALQVLQVLSDKGFPISAAATADGFAQAFLPARLELLSRRPVVLLDGAHNPDGLRSLAQAVKAYLPKKNAVCIMGMLKDKDSLASLAHIRGLFSTVLTLTPDNPRALDAGTLAQKAGAYFLHTAAMQDYEQAIKKGLALAGKDGALVVCGSLYLAAQLRPLLLKTVSKN